LLSVLCGEFLKISQVVLSRISNVGISKLDDNVKQQSWFTWTLTPYNVPRATEGSCECLSSYCRLWTNKKHYFLNKDANSNAGTFHIIRVTHSYTRSWVRCLFNSLGTVTVYGHSTVILRMSWIRLPAFLELRINFKHFNTPRTGTEPPQDISCDKFWTNASRTYFCLSLDISAQRHRGLNCNYRPVRHGLKITVPFNVLTIYSAPRSTARKQSETRTAHRD